MILINYQKILSKK